jgi:hypothetical protein
MNDEFGWVWEERSTRYFKEVIGLLLPEEPENKGKNFTENSQFPRRI